MNLEHKGKIALVTGGARDVGRDIALALASGGASVAINYRSSASDAQDLVKEIEDAGGSARAYQADIADYGAVTAMTKSIVADFGGIDILVNNAGLVQPNLFVDTGPEEWESQIGVGLYGVIHCCHAVVPHLIARQGGRIVNLVGDSARVGESRLSITAASRGGVLSLTKSLAKELGPSGITVNAVALGLIETAHSDKAWLDKYRDRIVKQYPTRRIGVPSDIAPLIALLASEGGAWITGQVMSVNGGYSMVG